MAKIIIQADGEIEREIPLTKERLTIGRRAHNDVVIDHVAISSQHAVIVVTAHDVFLEDLGSTNGTKVNGQPVRMHYLQHDDVIELAGFTIRYWTSDTGHARGMFAKEPVDATSLSLPDVEANWSTLAEPPVSKAPACIRVLTGISAGKVMALNKSIVTIGRPGLQVVAIASGPDGFSLMQIEGEPCPSINGKPLGDEFHLLRVGDVVSLLGAELQFCLVE